MEAYHLYLKGRYFWSKEGGKALERAAGYFQDSIAKDPHYALAYAGLSLCYFIMWVWDYRPEARAMLKGKQAALRAVEIDETAGPAHVSLGLSRLVYDWDWRGAHRSFLRAVELSPGDLYSHTSFAVYFMALGDMDQAIAECSLALEIDPLSPQAHTYLGMYYARAGLPEKAILQFQQAIEIQPDQPQAHWLLGQALILDACYAEGLQKIEKALEFSSQSPAVLAGLGWAYGMTGQTSDARQILRRLQRRSQKEYIRPYLMAKVYCAIGETDDAFLWLEKAFEERDRKLAFVKTDETLAGIRSDARFSRLVRKMGLPDAN
jgi:tetratricopeptide (TPR) repeat protein